MIIEMREKKIFISFYFYKGVNLMPMQFLYVLKLLIGIEKQGVVARIPSQHSTIMASSMKSNMRSSAKDDLKQQEIMQAVVIADNFNQKFTPLTNSIPMVKKVFT